jgi:chemotaxis receptor (MCP) glutamine deamidase CheD
MSEADEELSVTLYIGGYYATGERAVIRTVLGSCIAVCLFDPVACVGGMNHYMLPTPGSDAADPSRFGVYAMELLIGDVQKAGGQRKRLVAKVFGGAHVLESRESADSVPNQNIAFIDEFLTEERIPVLARDVGGRAPRSVRFHADSGRAFVRLLPPVAFHGVIAAEQAAVRRSTMPPPPRPNARPVPPDAELFED